MPKPKKVSKLPKKKPGKKEIYLKDYKKIDKDKDELIEMDYVLFHIIYLPRYNNSEVYWMNLIPYENDNQKFIIKEKYWYNLTFYGHKFTEENPKDYEYWIKSKTLNSEPEIADFVYKIDSDIENQPCSLMDLQAFFIECVDEVLKRPSIHYSKNRKKEVIVNNSVFFAKNTFHLNSKIGTLELRKQEILILKNNIYSNSKKTGRKKEPNQFITLTTDGLKS